MASRPKRATPSTELSRFRPGPSTSRMELSPFRSSLPATPSTDLRIPPFRPRPATPTPRKLDGATSATIPLIIRGNCEYDAKENRVVEVSQAPSQALKLVPEALSLLKTIKRPVAPIAICGPYRSGKSYFLSQLIGDPSAFKTCPTVQPCTHGIWMGTTVLDYKDFTIILFDTEGIDAVNGSSGGESVILVMSILLSSYLIYNSNHLPMRNDLDQLSHFLHLSKSIVVRASGDSKGDLVDFRDHFPQFLWLLRDVSLKPTDQSGKPLTATEYLTTQVLRPQNSAVSHATDKVASCIMKYFPSVECQILPLPSCDTDVLENMTDMDLSDKFTKRRKEVKKFIFQSVNSKRGFNRSAFVTGPVLASLAKQYVQIINTPGKIIGIDICWENAVKASLDATSDSLLKKYKQNMAKRMLSVRLPIEESIADRHSYQTTLMGIHSLEFLPLRKQFKEELECLMPPHTDSSLQQFDQKIIEYDSGSRVVTGGALYPFLLENRKKSQEQCEAIFNELYVPIKQQIDERMRNPESTYSYKKLVYDLKIAYEEYSAKAVGPAKEEVFKEKGAAVMAHCDYVFKVADAYGAKLFEKTCEAHTANANIERMQEELSRKEAKVEEMHAEEAKRKQQYKEDIERTLKMEMEKNKHLLRSEMEEERIASQKKMDRLHKQQTEEMEARYQQKRHHLLEEIQELKRDKQLAEQDAYAAEYATSDTERRYQYQIQRQQEYIQTLVSTIEGQRREANDRALIWQLQAENRQAFEKINKLEAEKREGYRKAQEYKDRNPFSDCILL